jgi:hypothetical protein
MGKPLNYLKFNLEPTIFEGGKTVYYINEDGIISEAKIVAGYESNSIFNEGYYGITDNGIQIDDPMEIVDWNYEYLRKYLNEFDCFDFNDNINQIFYKNIKIADIKSDYVAGTKTLPAIKYEDLNEDTLIKLIAGWKDYKNDKSEPENVETEPNDKNLKVISEGEQYHCNINPNSEIALNTYWVKYKWTRDDTGKKVTSDELVLWDAKSIMELETGIKNFVGTTGDIEILNISLVKYTGLSLNQIQVLLDHFKYSIKDIKSWDELTAEEKAIISKRNYDILVKGIFKDRVI